MEDHRDIHYISNNGNIRDDRYFQVLEASFQMETEDLVNRKTLKYLVHN